MNLTDGRLAQAACCDKLEMALLSFFEQFRKIYIGDQVQKTSKVYRRLSEVLGLNDEAMVLSVIIRKVSPLSLSLFGLMLLRPFYIHPMGIEDQLKKVRIPALALSAL